MLSVQFLQYLTQFRSIESNHYAGQVGSQNLTDEDYINSISLMLKEMERLELHRTTRFMAKKYFDCFLNTHPNISADKISLYLITCIRTAVKFNELSELADEYTINFCCEQCEGQYKPEQFVASQIQLLRILKFKLNFVTPYDYLFILDIFPKQKEITQGLEYIIDFCSSLAEIRTASSEEIFFGSLYYCSRIKNAPSLYYDIMKATTLKWEQAIALSEVIQRKVFELSEDELTQCQEQQVEQQDLEQLEECYQYNSSFDCSMQIELCSQAEQQIDSDLYDVDQQSQMVPE